MPELNPNSPRRYLWIFFFGAIYAVGLFYLGYRVERYESLQLISGYSVLFAAYLSLAYFLKDNVGLGIYLSFALRLILIVSIPSLSDDFYRFIWDGRLWANGINPFLETPDHYFQQMANGSIAGLPGINEQLYGLLGNTRHHTIYPPLAQVINWTAVKLGGDSILGTVVVMRIFALTAEAGTLFYVLPQLIKKYKLPGKAILLYGLNPLVILELTGNLHHEVYFIFFLLLALRMFKLKKPMWRRSAFFFGFSVIAKLIPVIFMPLLVRRLGIRKVIAYGLIVSGLAILCFLPFLNKQFFLAMWSSGLLYFQKFEFNGSIYYLVREVGYFIKGYNIIETSGKWMAALSLVGILAYAYGESLRKVRLPQAMMWVLGIYLAFATTLHPWYIIPLLTFSVFTPYRFPVFWSFLIFWTYTGYSQSGYEEPIELIVFQYVIVYAVMAFEVWRENKGAEERDKVRLSEKKP